MATGDDAGVYSLGDGRALVQTVDIFTPVVDSPRDWGRIAAANALSDVYAMGGTPLTALQYLGWPRDELSLEIASEVIAGGMDVIRSADCTVVGGHSIDSPEPTFGYAVTGIVGVDAVVSNQAARADDALVLTKPLGTGIVTTAIKRGRCPEALASEAIEWMASLNRAAGENLAIQGAHAATDVTGFGLLGHLRELCQASDTGAVVEFDEVPILDGVVELLEEGMWPGGSQRNLLSLEPDVDNERRRSDMKLLADAQTSGGLIVALPPDRVSGYLEAVEGTEIGYLTSDKRLRLT